MARHYGKIILLAIMVLMHTACATHPTLQHADVRVQSVQQDDGGS